MEYVGYFMTNNDAVNMGMQVLLSAKNYLLSLIRKNIQSRYYELTTPLLMSAQCNSMQDFVEIVPFLPFGFTQKYFFPRYIRWRKTAMYNVDLQHSKKKYHAIERIRLLLDQGSFRETGAQVWNYAHQGDGNRAVPYDGVITGYGTVHGKPVYVFSQDFTVKAGTIGRAHGEQIAQTIERAVRDRCPVIGIYDSGGARIEESINALAGCADMLHWNTLASGSVPQISVVLGPCAGAASYSTALSDFVFMVESVSYMYVTGPDVVKSVSGSVLTHKELGGAKVHS